MEPIGTTNLNIDPKFEIDESINMNFNISLEVYICSLEHCSHVETKASKGLLSSIKENRRKVFSSGVTI